MRRFCSYLDANFLPRGLALYRSLERVCPDFELWVLCLDDLSYRALGGLGLSRARLVRLEELERFDPGLPAVKAGRSPLEYALTCTPILPRYVLAREPAADAVTYLDADLFFFSSPAPLFDELGDGSIAVTEHRYARHLKGTEARFGVYNDGWVAFRRTEQGLACLRLWRERCLEWCYNRVEGGRFTEQKYLDEWPALFPELVSLRHPGANVAPWNLADRLIEAESGRVTVEGQPLIFYHFSCLQEVTPWLYDTKLANVRTSLTAAAQRWIYEPYLAALRGAVRELRGAWPEAAVGVRTRWSGERAGRESWTARTILRGLRDRQLILHLGGGVANALLQAAVSRLRAVFAGDAAERSDVFCVMPWAHLLVRTNGEVRPCCAASPPPIGRLGESSLRDAWNSKGMRRLRLDMLEGRSNPACAPCHEKDAAGAESIRRGRNSSLAQFARRARRTRPDGSLDERSVPSLELQFSNLCNFRCRTCAPDRSSSWHEDALRLGDLVAHPKVIAPTRDPEELWRQIEPLLGDVREIYFTGGEPLMQEGHYRVLEWLARRRRYDVRLQYATNFSVMSLGGRDVMKLWDRFRVVRVGASLDAQGRRGEYLRKGQEWPQVPRNRERMLRDCPRVDFFIQSTLSAMNAFDIPRLHADWLERGWIGINGLAFNLLTYPAYYKVQILPRGLKAEVERLYEQHLEFLRRSSGELLDARTENHYRSAVRFMKAQDLPRERERFRERTSELDRIREERFVDLFPELEELMRPVPA